MRVTWTSKDAKQVTLNGENVDKNGAKVYTPDNTTTYTAVAKRGSKEARSERRHSSLLTKKIFSDMRGCCEPSLRT